LAIAGFSALAIYSETPGQVREAAPAWPAGSVLALDPQRDNLVMFVHPWCPCSEASLAELEEILGRHEGRLSVQIVFLRPDNVSGEAVMASLWHHAQRIPGVTVRPDLSGREAGRFHAGVSGDTFLFTKDGALAFRGGITGARGHIGENEGRSAVEDFLDHRATPVKTTPVFGCPLSDPPVDGQKS
jgi:hypothetical protein